jgi:hypothetical protein
VFTEVSKRTIEVLRASLPAVNAHRSTIIGGMRSSLAAADPAQDEWRVSRIATSLVDALIDEARNLVDGAGQRRDDEIRLEHERQGIGRFHYSRFGDAIAPVMVDAAGTALAKAVGGAWVDTFWAMIRRMKEAGQSGVAYGQDRTRFVSEVQGQRLRSMA